MREARSALAPGPASAPLTGPHLAPLAGEWAMWRDVAVRTAGFPVSGLDVFGSPDEQAGLRAVARDPLFQTAVTWQNRAAMRNAVAKIAGGEPAAGSRQRQREETVASYWQRYCAKNDTIGFFGPLAWGRAVDDGPVIDARCGQLVSASTVCFEAWAIQALAEALDPDLTVPAGPQSERDLRAQLNRSRPALRGRGLAALDRLERCRSAAARTADPGVLDEALGDLDRVFEELTGRSATRRPGQTYAARTLLYLDCMRDLDLTVGPGIRDELAATLPPLLAGARWYCGRVYEAARRAIREAAAATGTGPLDRVLETVLPALRHRLPDVVAAANDDLRRRWSALLADPDRATIGARAAAAFAGHMPAWPTSVYQSADIQIAAPSAAAVNAGDYLCVVGDFHPGANPLGQGVFATRHPDRDRFLGAIASDVGTLPFLVPSRDVGFQTTRNMPAITRPGDVHVTAGSRDRMPDGYRTLPAAGLITDGETVTTPDGSWQVPLPHLLWLPVMIAAVHAYDPFPADGHSARITIGRTVWQRETWRIPPAHGPARPEDAASWARGHGLPRRVFALVPGEIKPLYIDFDSPVLTRILCRQLRRAGAGFPGRPVRFTEMLPGPEDCWLTGQDGRRYTSELRLVAVDLGRIASRGPEQER
jgi:lantibiotic biosynthesis dehydratase-like protein